MAEPFGELELIARIRRGEAARVRRRGGVVLGIGDDCALLRVPRGHELAVTTDLLLEGRHFRRDWHPAESAGHRALARGLSDLAAMGARPMAAFLSLALPPGMLARREGRRWVDGFFVGLGALAERFGVPLAGGDTGESPADLILADVVLTGSVPAGRALRRSGGRPGDLLYVTGGLGGSAAELEWLAAGGRTKAGVRQEGMHPQLYPEPRVAVGMALLRRGIASAAIDLSDGMSSDLAHLCRESGVGAEIEQAALPVHALAQTHGGGAEEVLARVLNGGEDYELLFAARPGVRVPRRLAGSRITRIGRLVRGGSGENGRVMLVDADGERRPLRPAGWEHLNNRS